jgi:ElaB/YqjD/DUF883 family membrane-anchored ribosome-binding protein
MSEPGETVATPTATTNDDASTSSHVADAASRGVADTAAAARDSAKDVADEAVTQAKAVAGEARQQMSTLVDQTKGELSKQAGERTNQAAGGLRTFAGQVDALASGHPEQSGPLAGLLDEARDRATAYADRLESGGPRQLAADVSDFARRRPIVFLAAAAGAGFVAGRLARAGRAAVQDPDPAYAAPSVAPPAAIGAVPAPAATPLDRPDATSFAPPVGAQVP